MTPLRNKYFVDFWAEILQNEVRRMEFHNMIKLNEIY